MSEDPVPVGELLGSVAPQLGLGAAAEAGRIWKVWPEVAGAAIAAHAEPTSLRDGVLRVRVDQPAWATELGYLAPELAARLNQALGAAVVAEVKIWVGARQPVPGGSRAEPGGARSRRKEALERPPPADLDEAIARAYEAWRRRYGNPPKSSERPGRW